jgi:hypothetical protein
MRTTLLNPTVWLLAATLVAAIAGAVRRRHARESIAQVVRCATAWPVLLVLVGLAAAGIGSRAVLGVLSPGAYAEEVLAARTFLDERQLYGANSEAQIKEALAEPGAPIAPWARLPGITPCQANAMSSRARFYTEHAHTPMLLLAGVPVVHLGGGRGLYALLLLLSAGAVLAMTAVLAERAGFAWRSRGALLILAAVAGWQPVLAGVRQGDAVLVAAGLVAVSWYFVARGGNGTAGIAAALAGCLALPAIGVLPALARTAPRAAALAVTIVAAAVGVTVAVAGLAIVPGFLQTAAETARTYAAAPPNYGVAGRLLAATGSGVLLAALALVIAGTWWRARGTDAAFAAFVTIGLLIAPVVWSQHLALVLVPAVVLLRRIAIQGSPVALAAWALLALSFSLADGAAARLGQIVSAGLQPAPIVPAAILVLWAWSVFGDAARRPLAAAAGADALEVQHSVRAR